MKCQKIVREKAYHTFTEPSVTSSNVLYCPTNNYKSENQRMFGFLACKMYHINNQLNHCCNSLVYLFGFGLLVGQNKQFDDTLALTWAIFCHFIALTIHIY